jgi:hypothetical protein
MNGTPHRASWAASQAMAIFEPSGAGLHIDSPKNACPTDTP